MVKVRILKVVTPLIFALSALQSNLMNKNLYLIAGCNGAGKITASRAILPKVLHCREFINADEIAKDLSPFNPEGVAVQAGKLMLKRFADLLAEEETFAVETTLATKTYIKKINQGKSMLMTGRLMYCLFAPRNNSKTTNPLIIKR